jgi:hypothetical protein
LFAPDCTGRQSVDLSQGNAAITFMMPGTGGTLKPGVWSLRHEQLVNQGDLFGGKTPVNMRPCSVCQRGECEPCSEDAACVDPPPIPDRRFPPRTPRVLLLSQKEAIRIMSPRTNRGVPR